MTVKTQNPINNLPLTIVATGNTTAATSSGTLDMRSVSISALGGASVGFSNSDIIISAPATSALSFVAIGNTTGSTSSTTFQNAYSISGAGGDSVGFSGNTIIISGGAGGGGGTLTITASSNNGGGTTSSGTIAVSNLVISAAGALTAGLNANTLVLSAATAGATQSWSAVGNTTASTSSTSFGTGVSISGAGGASVGFSGQSIVISAPQGYTLSRTYFPQGAGVAAAFASNAWASGTMFIQYCPFDVNISCSRAAIYFSLSQQTSAAAGSSGSWSATINLGLYTKNGTSYSSWFSSSTALTYGWTSNAAGTSVGTGARIITIPFATLIPPNEYWAFLQISTITSGGQLSATQTLLNVTGVANLAVGNFSVGAGNAGIITEGHGTLATTASTMPVSAGFVSAAAQGAAYLLHFDNWNVT